MKLWNLQKADLSAAAGRKSCSALLGIQPLTYLAPRRLTYPVWIIDFIDSAVCFQRCIQPWQGRCAGRGHNDKAAVIDMAINRYTAACLLALMCLWGSLWTFCPSQQDGQTSDLDFLPESASLPIMTAK